MKIVADNLNALNPVVFQAIKKCDAGPIQALALQCVKAKANFIDINPGYLSKGQEDRMAFMVEAVQAVTGLDLILDSPDPRVLAKGLAVCQGRTVINALTLEERKLEEILPLAVEYQTPLVLLLLDAHSRPATTLEGKIALAIELRERALTAGLPEERLLYDPLLPHLSWPDAFSQIKAVIEIVRYLSSGALFNNPAQTMVGLSNLQSGYGRKDSSILEKICLSLLAGAGLSHVLANVLRPELGQVLQQIQPLIQ
jgi:5-methyltetrahydrofolate corrinoid/iron sulfur protein methyltransferase